MTRPQVWTERESSGVGWTDCTYCSLLMVIVGSGFSAFPLKPYTEPERKAFRHNDPRLNFAGGVQRARERYGLTVASPTPYSQGQLRTALSAPGRVFAVAGKLSNFPQGHKLRRWAPNFTGSHAVAVMPLGNGQVLWLDPLAPNLYAGDTVAVTEVADRFCLGNYPNDARYMALGDNAPVSESIATVTLYPDGVRTWSAKGGNLIGYRLDGSTKTLQLAAGSTAHADGTATITQDPQRAPQGSGFIRVTDGALAGYYLLRGSVDGPVPNPPPEPEPDPDCEAAVEDERARWQAWLEARPTLGIEEWLEQAPE